MPIGGEKKDQPDRDQRNERVKSDHCDVEHGHAGPSLSDLKAVCFGSRERRLVFAVKSE